MQQAGDDNGTQLADTPVPAYLPKYNINSGFEKNNLILTIRSLVLYLGIGYLLFRRVDIIFILAGIILLHEAGHYVVMKYYDYSDVSVFFLPFFGAYVSGKKREVSKRESAVVLLAGPLPGIIIGLVIFFIDKSFNGIYLGSTSLLFIAQLFVWLNVLNLLPIMPLDGGQLLNRVFFDEEGWLSNIFIAASGIAVIWFAIKIKFYLLILFPLIFISRFISIKKNIDLEKKLTEQGINTDLAYEELSDEDYWKIRNIIVQNTPAFSNVATAPPNEYDIKEEKIAHEVENSLQRNLIFDISISQKIIIVIIWASAIITPFLLEVGVPFFNTYVIK